MSSIFFNIIGTVLVLNILFLLVPDGKFSKHVQFTAGLIVILTVAGNLITIEPDHATLNFDEDAFYYDSENLENAVKKDLVEDSIRLKLREKTGIDADVEVETENGNITHVTVFTEYSNYEEITDTVVQYCDINRSLVVVK